MAKVHICAFNADEYSNHLEPNFPEVRFSVGESQKELGAGLDDCEVLLAFGAMLNDGVFRENKNLKWVQAMGTGVDGIIDQSNIPSDILITSMRGIHGPQMSELAFLLMLALNRRFQKIMEPAKYAKRLEKFPENQYKPTYRLSINPMFNGSAVMVDKARLETGPASATIAIPGRGPGFRRCSFTGVGLPQPNPANIIMAVPMGSKCASG